MDNSQMLLAAISALVAAIGILSKVIHVLYKESNLRGEKLVEFAERMLKGEFCENCQKSH